jgi:hypothetical protein
VYGSIEAAKLGLFYKWEVILTAIKFAEENGPEKIDFERMRLPRAPLS